MILILVCFGAAVCGMCLGYSSPALPDMEKNFPQLQIGEAEKSWISSVMSLGALAGAGIGGFMSNYLGRKASMLLINIPFIGGYLMLALAENVYMLYAGRFISGIPVGIVFLCAPVYIAEMSLPDYRGMCGTIFQIMVTIGILGINLLGICLNFKWTSNGRLQQTKGIFWFIFYFSHSARLRIWQHIYNEFN